MKQISKQSFLFSRRILGTALPALFAGVLCVSSAQADVDTTWTDFTGFSPYSANTTF
jgi:hypothetical protein